MERRDFLETLIGGSLVFIVPASLLAQPHRFANGVALKCLGDRQGPRYLDGRTNDGTVGLAPALSKRYSGTKWSMVRASENIVTFKCMGLIEGPRWLDGRTHNGTMGLAPNTNKPYTGTRWQLVPADQNNSDIVYIKCLGELTGPRWLDGRTHDGTVWLAERTTPPFTGTKWEIQPYPGIID
jgi:hypothetical protein